MTDYLTFTTKFICSKNVEWSTALQCFTATKFTKILTVRAPRQVVSINQSSHIICTRPVLVVGRKRRVGDQSVCADGVGSNWPQLENGHEAKEEWLTDQQSAAIWFWLLSQPWLWWRCRSLKQCTSTIRRPPAPRFTTSLIFFWQNQCLGIFVLITGRAPYSSFQSSPVPEHFRYRR